MFYSAQSTVTHMYVQLHCNAASSYYTYKTVRLRSGPGTFEMGSLQILIRMFQFLILMTDSPMLLLHFWYDIPIVFPKVNIELHKNMKFQ
jgi:hypothetical protein